MKPVYSYECDNCDNEWTMGWDCVSWCPYCGYCGTKSEENKTTERVSACLPAMKELESLIGQSKRVSVCLAFLEGIPTSFLEKFQTSDERIFQGVHINIHDHIICWARNNPHIFGKFVKEDWVR